MTSYPLLFVRQYRSLLKEAQAFPIPKVSRKLQQNIRDSYILFRHETCSEALAALLTDGAASLRLMRQLRDLPAAHFHSVFGDLQ